MIMGFSHSKTMVVDGEVSTVGSTNFDNRSFRLISRPMPLSSILISQGDGTGL